MMRRRPAIVFGLAAILLMAPSLWLGTMPSHSSPQNITWAAQFAEQFRAGILNIDTAVKGLNGECESRMHD